MDHYIARGLVGMLEDGCVKVGMSVGDLLAASDEPDIHEIGRDELQMQESRSEPGGRGQAVMNQWEKYGAEMLLDIADSTNAPDEYDGARVTFRAKDGWKVSICYEACGDLDYVEHFIAPDGEIVDFWKWPVPEYGYLDPRYDDSPRGRLIAWQGVRRPTGNDVYIDEHRTRYYPLSAEAHFLLQRRLEVAQEALKPFAKRADWLDQTAGWRAANRRTSLVALSAMMHARDVLLEQKVWDRLAEENGNLN